jgi:hypothetical protein
MIVWLLDLQLPMQLVPITTNVVSLNPALDFWLKKFFLCDLPFLIFCISDIIHCICKRRKILSMNRDYLYPHKF